MAAKASTSPSQLLLPLLLPLGNRRRDASALSRCPGGAALGSVLCSAGGRGGRGRLWARVGGAAGAAAWRAAGAGAAGVPAGSGGVGRYGKIPQKMVHEIPPEGRRIITNLDQILLNGKNITMLVPGGEGPEV